VTAGAVVQIRGLNEFRRTLRKAEIDLSDLKEANYKAAAIVAGAAASLAPRRTGRLAGSLKPARQVARARISSRLIYAGVIHYGWPGHNIEPDPFLNVATQATAHSWLAVFDDAIQRIADSVRGA
jgi:hypothetical protein